MNTISHNQLEKELLKDKELEQLRTNPSLSLEIAEMVHEARIIRGLTQEKLAEKVGTKQSSIARLENGKGNFSISFLDKIASALETELIPPKLLLVESYKNKPEVEQKGSISKFINFKNIFGSKSEWESNTYGQ
jgi:transcriptional regulator with XRE-family HTH domain